MVSSLSRQRQNVLMNTTTAGVKSKCHAMPDDLIRGFDFNKLQKWLRADDMRLKTTILFIEDIIVIYGT